MRHTNKSEAQTPLEKLLNAYRAYLPLVDVSYDDEVSMASCTEAVALFNSPECDKVDATIIDYALDLYISRVAKFATEDLWSNVQLVFSTLENHYADTEEGNIDYKLEYIL